MSCICFVPLSRLPTAIVPAGHPMPRCPRTLRRLLSALALSLVAAPPGAAFTGDDMSSLMRGMGAMMQMWNMYNALKNPGSGTGWGGLSGFPGGQGLSGFPGMQGLSGFPGMQGLSGMPEPPWSARERTSPVPVSPFARDPRGPGPEARLAGVWQGSGGEVFMARGDAFRLMDSSGRAVEGRFLVHGRRLVVYLPDPDQVRLYEFEHRGDAFAIKDDYGQITLFRRAGGARPGPRGGP